MSFTSRKDREPEAIRDMLVTSWASRIRDHGKREALLIVEEAGAEAAIDALLHLLVAEPAVEKSIEELAREQGVEPFDPEKFGRSDITDKEADAFLEALADERPGWTREYRATGDDKSGRSEGVESIWFEDREAAVNARVLFIQSGFDRTDIQTRTVSLPTRCEEEGT